MPNTATAVAGANIALVKYWGQRDAGLALPLNGSISMTLDTAQTRTTVSFEAGLPADEVTLNGRPADASTLARVTAHLGRLRALVGRSDRARVTSANTFPTGAGIASSASGYAALTAAAASALGLELSPEELSREARVGSGSACRSIFGGYVEWLPGTGHADSYAVPLAPASHWALVDLVAVVSDRPKGVGSTEGHAAAETSPLMGARLESLKRTLPETRAAILNRDFEALGELAEAEALSLHAIIMTARPGHIYWTPGTVAVLHAVRAWRRQGLRQCYFTIDAGPNVHVLCRAGDAADVGQALRALPEVMDVIACGVGEGVRVTPGIGD